MGKCFRPRLTRMIGYALLMLFVLAAPAVAAQAEEGAGAALPPPLAGVEWRPAQAGQSAVSAKVQCAEGQAYLFLPACADWETMVLSFPGEELTLQGPGEAAAQIASGEPFDITSLFPGGEPEDGVYLLTAADGAGNAAELRVMQSANQAAMWLESADPVGHGREWVDSAEVEAKLTATGRMTMLDEGGETLYNGELRELRGRGNTTWSHYPKKPYQIKLEDKADLLQNGGDNTARTWVLLAEAYDGTLLHNTVSLALGAALGLEGTPECRPVDLYYDGEYRGYYLLCEKVQVGESRLDILDYGKLLEESTPGLDNREDYPLAEEQNDYGNVYQYVQGLESREDRAFLVELDKYSYRGEDCWFITYDPSTGLENPFAFQDPDKVPQEDAAFVGNLMQELVDCAVNGGENPITGMTLEEYVDVDALARYMLVHQLAKTIDLGETSVFFYLPQGSEVLKPGPIWDFDIAYGVRDRAGLEAATLDYVPYEGWMRELMRVPQLQERMKEVYLEELEPLIDGVLLGDVDQAQGTLLSLTGYEEKFSAAYRMNGKLWKRETTDVYYPTQQENMDSLRSYLTARRAWLSGDMELWFGELVERVGLVYTPGHEGETGAAAAANPFPHYIIEAMEETPAEDGSLEVALTLIANEGISFDSGMTATVNGEEAMVSENDGGACRVVWTRRGE